MCAAVTFAGSSTTNAVAPGTVCAWNVVAVPAHTPLQGAETSGYPVTDANLRMRRMSPSGCGSTIGPT